MVKELKTVTQGADNTLTTLQRQDESLKKCWEMVDKQVKTTNSASTKFVILKNVLHRLHQRGLHVTKQVVLPKEHHEKVFEMAHSTALEVIWGSIGIYPLSRTNFIGQV